MSVIYLSGPITGNPDYETLFNTADKELTADGYNVINPSALDYAIPVRIMTYEVLMRIDFMLIDQADILMLLPGWEKSPGCNRELGYAQAKGKTICVYTEEGGHFGEFKGRRP